MGLALVVLFLRRQRVNTSVISIGLDFMQIVSIFVNLNFQWPDQLRKLFAAASTSTFNTQVLAPECSISAWNFTLKSVCPCSLFSSVPSQITAGW